MLVLLVTLLGWAWYSTENQALEFKNAGAASRLRSANREPDSSAQRQDRLQRRYQEKGGQSLTPETILKMVKDFEATGLTDLPTVIPLNGEIRQKQEAWYLSTLDEALELTSRQKQQARERLDRMREADGDAFKRGLATVGDRAIPANRLKDDLPLAPFDTNASHWLSKEAYAPWRLIDLTPEQEALTVKSMGEAGWSSALPSPEDLGTRIAIFVPGVFARTPQQPSQGVFLGSSLLQIARQLHPAQLRLALLTNPLLPPLLSAELDQPSPPEVSPFANP